MKQLLLIALIFIALACNESTSDSETFVLNKIQIDSTTSIETYKKWRSDKDPWITYKVIDSDGNYFGEDNYEGSNSGYYFYDSKDSLTGKYRPYNLFEHSVDCFNDKRFYVAATKDYNSDTIVLACLDHSGSVLIEKKVPTEKIIMLRDIKPLKDGLILLYYSNNKNFLLKRFDNELNFDWEYAINDFVYYDGINVTSDYENITVSTHNQIILLDSKTGETKWSIAPKITPESMGGYKTTLVLKVKYVALHYFKINESDESFIDCSIDLIDINNGQISYSDSIKESKSDFQIYNSTNLVLDSNEFVVNYENEIWKYYLEKE
jgi:hypothetical protein